MPIDAGIYGQGPQIPAPVSPIQTLASIQQLRSNQALEQERAELAAKRKQETADVARAQQEDTALRALFSRSDAPPTDREIYGVVGPKRGAEILKGLDALKQGTIKTETDARQLLGSVLGGIKALPEPMRADAYTGARTHLIQTGILKPEDAPEQYAPEFVDAALRAALTPEQQQGADERAAVAAKVTYGAPQTAMVDGKRVPVRAGSDGRLYGTDQKPIASPNVEVNPATQLQLDAAKETQRHNRAQEGLEGQRITNEAGQTPMLTPEALDVTAHQYAMTGQLPPMGMGKPAAELRAKIINRAAEIYKGLDLPSQQASYQANKGSLVKMQAGRDAINAFEKTALKNIDLFLDAAGKVVDTGSPLANRIAHTVTGQVLGSPDQASFDAARQVAINEIAKITSNPNMSGVLSDSARKEVEAFNPQNATLKQAVSVMRTLKQDMANRATSLDDQLKDIKARIATPPASSTPKKIGRFEVIEK